MADTRRTVRINGYPIDIAKNEEIRYPSKVTKHPASVGSDFSDNIRNEGVEITLECLVSNTPIGRIAADPTRQVTAGASPIPSEDARASLLRVRASRQPIVVETTKGTFINMALEELSEVANSNTTGGLTFTAKFVQIVVRSNKRTKVRVATRLPGGAVDFGLSVDKITDGKHFLWRHGNPPGLSPGTIPKGVITMTEIVTVRGGKTVHDSTGKALNTKELQDFVKDLDRDALIMEERALSRLSKPNPTDIKVKQTLDNYDSYKDTKFANPGKKIDPKLFGLSGRPEAYNPNDPQQAAEFAARDTGHL
jgi:hypothetical protein